MKSKAKKKIVKVVREKEMVHHLRIILSRKSEVLGGITQ
jgi:hypothetical protein